MKTRNVRALTPQSVDMRPSLPGALVDAGRGAERSPGAAPVLAQMLSEEHTETVAAAVAVISRVPDRARRLAGEAAGVLAVAVLAALVWRSTSAAEAVERERDEVERRVRELDDRDSLTGAVRARRLDAELRRQLALAQRNRSRRRAHRRPGRVRAGGRRLRRATGDEMLLAGADVLREALRATDLISRTGTDSFVVILPDSDEDSARIVAGRLIRRCAASSARGVDGAPIDLQRRSGSRSAIPPARAAQTSCFQRPGRRWRRLSVRAVTDSRPPIRCLRLSPSRT